MDSKTVLAATKALQKYLKTQDDSADKAQLFEDAQEDAPFVYLMVTAKKYFGAERSLKPHVVPVPHSIWGSKKPSVLLFTRDPQRAYKDALQGEDGPQLVDRVVGVKKLKGKFKTYEARRALKSDHDLVVAEEDVITMLPRLLGKTFYQSQFSVPVSIRLRKDNVISAERAEKQLTKYLNSTVFLKPASTLLMVRVGTASMKPKEIAANVETVVNYIQEKFGDFGGFRTLGLKTETSPLLPIFYTKELYTEEDIGESDEEPIETEGKKRKREMAELDALLAEVVDEDEIRAYNREEKAKRRARLNPEAAAEAAAEEEANEDKE